MKESTSKLEAEVRMLRTFAQDTLELLKELREERLGSQPATTAPAYYGAQDSAGTAKLPMQGLVLALLSTEPWRLSPNRKYRLLHYPLHPTEL